MPKRDKSDDKKSQDSSNFESDTDGEMDRSSLVKTKRGGGNSGSIIGDSAASTYS